ncbi:MAG: hypothetical protein AB7S26_31290 [Sandaracinaceae bacterium]
MSMVIRRVVTVALVACALGCGGQAIARVQAAHGHEFRCDRRYVDVERRTEEEHRWVSRGCGFEAEWRCEDECVVLDSRAYGMGAP